MDTDWLKKDIKCPGEVKTKVDAIECIYTQQFGVPPNFSSHFNVSYIEKHVYEGNINFPTNGTKSSIQVFIVDGKFAVDSDKNIYMHPDAFREY